MAFSGIKKQLIKESAVSAVVLILLGGVVYYLGGESEEINRRRSTLEGEVNAASGDKVMLRDKFTKVQQSAGLYEEVTRKSAATGLFIDRQAIRERFSQFRNRYNLSNIKLTMGPIENLADPKYTRKNGTIAASDVIVTFEALSDEDVYNMLAVMPVELSGNIKITSFSISRNDASLDSVLRQIASQGPVPLVQAELKFKWLGIRTPEEAKPDAQKSQQPGL